MIEVPSGGRSRSLVPRSLDRVEERLILATCLVLAGVSVVGAIFEWPPAVYQPITFLALYAVLRILLPLRETPEELRQARMELAELKERLLNHECVDFRCYESSAEFYGALTEVVNSEARRQIDAWYVRKVPPTKFVQKAAKRYFSSVLQWAKNDPSRSVRRLICVHSPEMREWARRHHADTRKIANYEARIVEWAIKADLLNMAVIDQRIVFLAFSGATDQVVRGVSIRDARVAKEFTDLFTQHWAAATRLSDWVRQAR
ncbi:hypothetical protein TBS_13190 [Thermobispora bispora]|uniref:Uncharacterized protein n=1 Tax=Thermobispora bispora (strain ATCC 19993 / DSM 43833 / CBS 139.67 / JCM 10125 / KCTC 9307 / NBRC 14880 / R51) TaxID=469371 RepID=D6Y3S3_THEBD|nr:hypothetical protein [Thermobispora bispora]ADG89025.1 hypothetical protein Tbis_2315 [Thermobispora bispora DSM 43833]MBO2475642.1 hypothetical protein [Actinomycetales bacterium]MDI9581392.1 hypothetical protein [Thermobispora sp.]